MYRGGDVDRALIDGLRFVESRFCGVMTSVKSFLSDVLTYFTSSISNEKDLPAPDSSYVVWSNPKTTEETLLFRLLYIYARCTVPVYITKEEVHRTHPNISDTGRYLEV